MSSKTKIEWCDSTWNPVVGCSKVSAGCANCYAERMVDRFPHLTGMTHGPDPDPVGWNGRAHFMPHKLEQPFHWRRPRKIFVCSIGDLFHYSITDEHIAAVFGVMAACPQHTFIVLTKRPHRALEWFEWVSIQECSETKYRQSTECAFHLLRIAEPEMTGPIHCKYGPAPDAQWPLPNVWIGVSIEDQHAADDRVPLLLQIPAEKRFVSAEPLMGPVDLDDLIAEMGNGWEHHIDALWCEEDPEDCGKFGGNTLDWVICGAETGPGKRPMDPNWARSLRDQCKAASVPFFFKKDSNGNRELDGVIHEELPG